MTSCHAKIDASWHTYEIMNKSCHKHARGMATGARAMLNRINVCRHIILSISDQASLRLTLIAGHDGYLWHKSVFAIFSAGFTNRFLALVLTVPPRILIVLVYVCVHVCVLTYACMRPGGFQFAMFPHQGPCVRGPPSKDLYQFLRGGSFYTMCLMREHSK